MIYKTVEVRFFVLKIVGCCLFSFFSGQLLVAQHSAADSVLIRQASGFFRKAGDLYQKGDFLGSNRVLQQCIALREKVYGTNCIQNTSPLLNLANNYRLQGKLNHALALLQTAEQTAIQHYGNDYPGIGRIYQNIGRVLGEKEDFTSAYSYYQQAIELFTKDSASYYDKIRLTKESLISVLIKQKKFREAHEQIYNLLKSEHLNEIDFYDYLSEIYMGLQEYTKANCYFQKEIKSSSQQKESPFFYPNLALAYNNYANALIAQNRLEQVPALLDSAITILTQHYSSSSNLGRLYGNYGIYFLQLNVNGNSTRSLEQQRIKNLYAALAYLQKAVVAVSINFDNPDPLKNPPVDNALSSTELLKKVKYKAIAFSELAELQSDKDSKKSIAYYQKSLENYTLSTQLIHTLRTGFLSAESKLFLAENELPTYLNAIEISNILYDYTSDNRYLQSAFEYAEKSKSAMFLSAVRDIEAKAFGGIPDSLLSQEEEIKQELAFFHEQIFNESQHTAPDTEKLELWGSEVFRLDKLHEELTRHFEETYPKYHAFKYKNEVINIKDIQNNINSRQAILEYAINAPVDTIQQGFLTCFVITKKEAVLHSLPIDHTFAQDVENIQNFLINSNVHNTRKNQYAEYAVAAHRLYKQLIAPVAKYIKGKEITVIPDDKLAYIPFDALISKKPDTTRMDFHSLNYLIKDYAFSYSYSATLLFEYFKNKQQAPRDLLAVVPEYNPEKEDDRQSIWASLFPLSGANNEIKEISSQVKSDVLNANNALEKDFKKLAPEYDILHLAMHTVINDSIPMFSKLVFTNSMDSTEDNLLNTQEIYNMKLNARMAVLSACNTGTGQLRKGEGVMSLARGFLYAGCPSLIMTLWEVDDKSSAIIMKNFYRFLKKGKSKDEALRMAKLKHLENADPFKAHPYFWLSYVVVGNQSPLYNGNEVLAFIIIISILLIWLIADLLKRKK